MSQTKDLVSRAPTNECLKSTFFVSNIHCASCVAYITEVLGQVPGVNHIEVSILTHEVRVVHTWHTSASLLATTLIHAAFEVHHVTTFDAAGSSVYDTSTTSWWMPRESFRLSAQPHPTSLARSPSRDRHIANCDACRKEELDSRSNPAAQSPHHRPGSFWPDVKDNASDKELLAPRLSDVSAEVPPSVDDGKSVAESPAENEQFNARLSIGGMSCASCVNTVTNEVKALSYVRDVTVNLLTNSATLVFDGPKANVDKIVEQIEDIGFEASVDEVSPMKPASDPKPASSAHVAELAIVGMTCGSCVGAVTRGLEELEFVTDVSVNLLSHSGRVEFEGRENLDALVEKIEDLGFDGSVTSVRPLGKSSDSGAVEARTVAIRVDGMFCHHCPERVTRALERLPGVQVDDELSIKNPVVKVTYTPSAPSFTVRTLLEKVDGAHDAFVASVHHPPSVEDRSRAMQQHERRRLLTRLLFVFMVVVPTFLIGIVFMSLVSPQNPIRKYLEQSLWAGNVSRIEWALFIMSTPVMFYGADLFHVRAIKEVYSLWRPGSRVPILRRLYRFGSMNLLISAGTTVAYASSLAVLIMDAVMGTPSSTHSSTYFDSVVFLTFFILVGRFIEAYSKAKTGDAVASLGKLRPSEALLVMGDGQSESEEIQRVNVDLLDIGDVVSIPHGASPPADGVIVGAGSYQFDESTLTGESKPVSKTAGDQVYTGSVNVGQPVRISITAVGGSSMLDQIIAVVREGQSRRAPMERVADMLTSHFVPVITLIAILTFVVWLSLGLSGTLPDDYLDTARGGWTFWSLEFAIAVFVVACPCGLALAAPTALFVGGGLAARHGILVKGGGEAFQEASRLDAIVFDKTGTLTEGSSLKVSDHETLIPDSADLHVGWTLAQKLEESSNHPIARAISQFCVEKSTFTVVGSDIEERSGQGMFGRFTVSVEEPSDSKQSDKAITHYEAAIGNQSLLQSLSQNANTDLTNTLTKYQAAGKSTAILSLRKLTNPSAPFTPVLIFAISDSIRPETTQVITDLQARNIAVYMCTGDNATTATAVASRIGLPPSNVIANTTPSGKADFVRKTQDNLHDSAQLTPSETESQQPSHGKKKKQIVAFVGDGVNDSPALAAADVSIAMASGSDVAMNSADFILLNSELNTILTLVVLSRRVFNRVRMNFCWAVVYNFCLVPVAAGVFYPIVSGHKVVQDHAGSGGLGDGGMTTVDTHWRLSPVWAALAMALSSISVICSSLALAVDWGTVKRGFKWVVGKGSGK